MRAATTRIQLADLYMEAPELFEDANGVHTPLGKQMQAAMDKFSDDGAA